MIRSTGFASSSVSLITDDRPEIPVGPLKAFLVFRHEPLEMMEQHPVEDGPLRMSRAIDSRHIENEESRNAPGTSQEKSDS